MLVKPNIRRSSYSTDDNYVDALYRRLGEVTNTMASRIKYEICFGDLYEEALSLYFEIQKYNVDNSTIPERPTYSITADFPSNELLLWVKNGYKRKEGELVRFKLKSSTIQYTVDTLKVIRTTTGSVYTIPQLSGGEYIFAMPGFNCTLQITSTFNYLGYLGGFGDYVCAIATPVYSSEFYSFVCEKLINSIYSEFGDYVCSISEYDLTYSSQFTDFSCEKGYKFSAYSSEFTTFNCEKIISEAYYYTGLFGDYVCNVVDAVYSSEFTDFNCEHYILYYNGVFGNYECATTIFNPVYSSEFTDFNCEEIVEPTPPPTEKTFTLVFSAILGRMTASFKLAGNSMVTIMWGDGNVEGVNPSISTTISHTYDTLGEFAIRISDSSGLFIVQLEMNGFELYMNEMNNLPSLTDLRIYEDSIIVGSVAYLDRITLPSLNTIQIYEENVFSYKDLADVFEEDTRSWEEISIYGTDLEYSSSDMPLFDTNGFQLTLYECGLTTQSIDNLLADILANDTSLSITRSIDLRENEDPSAAGLATISALIANGWTIQHGEEVI